MTRPWTPEEAEDHGYYHWTCRHCGASGWTDTTPDCDCDREPPEPRFNEQSGNDHLRHIMEEAKKLK